MNINSSKIELIPYNQNWPYIFKKEALVIQKALGALLKEIYHIGSTSIPDMPAKPAIDMLLVLENIDDIKHIEEKLTQLGYDSLRRQIIPHFSFFTRRQDSKIRFHLHLHERGSPQIQRHVNFRDYVRQDHLIAEAYAELKIRLAAQFANDPPAYVSGKDSLVQKIDAKAKLWSLRKIDYLTPNTGPLAKDWSKEKLVKAMVANLNVHMTHFAQYLEAVELVRVPGFTIVNSNLSNDTFNFVLDADFSSAEAAKKILEITTYFSNKSMPFSWWISPSDQPKDLASHLKIEGYKNTENHIAMYFDLDAFDSEIFSIHRLKIIRATDAKGLKDFASVLASDISAFKKYFSLVASVLTLDDPVEFYVGYMDGKPVVRGLSCYFGQVAGLYWLSITPSERGKGYAKAMQIHRLKRAKELGYHIAVLQASKETYPLYKNLGYQEWGNFSEYKK